jgi:two-component system CheB/CheR fusion protein
VRIASAGAGQGTEVAVRLPLVAERAQLDDALDPGEEPSTKLAGLSILVVEDSDDARESFRDLLRLLGARVSVACNGREGLDAIEAAEPDLVLCDLRMPRMDGYEFMRALRRDPLAAHPPVLAMSGLAAEADLRRTRDAGFAGHIKKPFSEAAITGAIRNALQSRQ